MAYSVKTSSLCCLGIQPRGLFRENLKSVLTNNTASWPIPDLAILHGCTTITANFISNAKILPQIPDANFGTIKYIYSVYQCMRMYSICYPPYNVLYTVRKKILEKWTINVYWWVGVKDTDSIIYVSITVCIEMSHHPMNDYSWKNQYLPTFFFQCTVYFGMALWTASHR